MATKKKKKIKSLKPNAPLNELNKRSRDASAKRIEARRTVSVPVAELEALNDKVAELEAELVEAKK